MMRFVRHSLMAMLVLCGVWKARGQTTRPADSPLAPGLEVHEWAVFVLDPLDNKLNPDGIVQSTLPSSAITHRQEAPESAQDKPFPVGIIRFLGAADSKVDVKIEKMAGTFLSSWPKAQSRSNQLLWQDLTLANDNIAAKVERVSDSHWFSRLRKGNSAFITSGQSPAEQFLLYDIEMPYPCPLKFEPGKEGAVALNNVGQAPLHDLVLYQLDHGVLKQAIVGELVAFKSPSAPATAPLAQMKAQLVTTPTTQPADLTANWKHTLGNTGMSAADTDIVVDLIIQYAFAHRSLTAVYRLDDAEFDRILPLEVVPQPRKVVRVGLVIVRNLDPAAGNEIDDLITQLGDPVWANREAAFNALKALGPAALPKLQGATKNKDVEIAWRAEKLLGEK